MIRMLISIALNRNLRGDPVYIRCARCGTIAGDMEGAPLRVSSMIVIRHGQLAEHTVTPPEWTCPSCGRPGPLEIGEKLASDALARCRRTFLCRYVWKVPRTVVTVTCPRCHTRQPAVHVRSPAPEGQRRRRLRHGTGHRQLPRPLSSRVHDCGEPLGAERLQ
jgi:hypothetical protein